jgi:hypothetical protein
MTIDTVQAMVIIIVGLIMVSILLRILLIVHRQGNKIRELENRIKATNQMEVDKTNG